MPALQQPPMPTTIGALFTRPPMRFGLRGDAALWAELADRMAEAPLPDGRWQLQRQLEAAWREAVGVRLSDSREPIHVERLDPGHGMSAGRVLPAWWHDSGIVLLVDRFSAFTGEH